MEEKDVSSIANAVSRELTKLNFGKNENPKTEMSEEVFKCPDCGIEVKGGIAFCQACGCPLEWGE